MGGGLSLGRKPVQGIPLPVDPFFTSVKLLMDFEGANGSTAFVDQSAAPHTITAVNQAQISTARSKFGTSSGLFDGTGDAITAPAGSDWTVGAGDMTAELFAYFNSLATGSWLMGTWGGSNANSAFYVYQASGQLFFSIPGLAADSCNVAASISAGQFYHVCAERAGSILRVYLNGAMIGKTTGATGTGNTSTAVLSMGGGFLGGYDFNGNFGAARFSKGVARYNSDLGFIPPTAAFPRQ